MITIRVTRNCVPPVPMDTTISMGTSGKRDRASCTATAVGLLATMPPSQYISLPIMTGLNTVGAAVDARRAYRCKTRKDPGNRVKNSKDGFRNKSTRQEMRYLASLLLAHSICTWMSRSLNLVSRIWPNLFLLFIRSSPDQLMFQV